jgi:hypothetical protein
VQRSPSSSYCVSGNDHENDYISNSYTNYIPTLVNGQVCFDKDRHVLCESDNKSHMQLLLCEVTQKLIINKKRFSNCHEHKVLLIGDSHLRGCAA